MSSAEMESRFIQYASKVINLEQSFTNSFASIILKKQLIRSATSVAFNFSESRASESTKDFIHKLSLSLKELRETDTNLKLINLSNLNRSKEDLDWLIEESNVLISILVSSIKTLKKKM